MLALTDRTSHAANNYDAFLGICLSVVMAKLGVSRTSLVIHK